MPQTRPTGGGPAVEQPAADMDSVAGRLERNARAFPDKPAVIHPDGRTPSSSGSYTTITYGELQQTVEELARGFRRAGITRGTRTVLMAPPGPELFALCFALFRVGAVPVVVDPGMGVRRMLHCYRAVGAEAFIGPPLAQLVRVLGRRTFAGVRVPVTLGRRRLGRGHTLAALRTTSASASRADAAALTGGDDLLMIGFTTGSTGPAKGVEYTHRMALSIARQIEAVHDRTRDDVSLVTLPFYGVLDLVYGSTLVLAPLAPARVAQADPVLLVDALERFGVTTMFASPALLRNLAGHLTGTARGRHPLPDLRCVVSGGAPVPDAVVAALRRVLDEKAKIHVTYGATEVLPITSIEAAEILGDDDVVDISRQDGGTAARAAAGEGTCVGRPVPGTRVTVVPVTDGPLARLDSTTSLPTGHVGEILVHGESVSRRYHRAPDSDAAHKVTEERPGGEASRIWHRTGDLGHLDAEGRLWFCGRAVQRVRTGHRDLHTVRCEGVFNAHPLVRRTALVGIGPAGAQRPVICVETEPGEGGAALDESAWTKLVAELRTMAESHAATTGLQEFLRHPAFPVDIRHNAKIGREELARWAERQQASSTPSPGQRAARLVPLAGWAYLVGGAVWAATAGVPDLPVLRWLWWVDAFLSIGVHAAQIPLALPRGRAAGHGTASVVGRTMLYGATWWRAL
ncbi:fatty acid CoA ligase family protein [Streptomyces avidinii]|uniref:Acyl-CoA synthetase (AMP-forming)/AMP-acid ligase II n=1 Tax=Streptomyces avidinii TaxID=1895 RepID=A0ABS4LFV8_STRAV|nr:fatty acid CoA ligase family protein [Streptomyces avidinii]MBP2040994.1 acyl-CoA synthetase (AMP-forming)/AMP-acid ligase II [Streptomyces avidinii]GGZ05432.1 peptide synthase [Streptomyces avidinii]